MTDRELMQQALEALRSVQDHRPNDETNNAIAALRKRLAQPEQKPVAWANLNELTEQFNSVNCGTVYRLPDEVRSPLYTSPPQRKPLTEEEIELLTTDPRFAHIETPTLAEFARAVIAKATGEKE